MIFKTFSEKQSFIDQIETLIIRYADDGRDYSIHAIFLTKVLMEFIQAQSAIKDKDISSKP